LYLILFIVLGIESISDYLEKEKEELPPHLYHIGKQAFKSMCTFGLSQSVVVSGESGAGMLD
jgi:myosin heavy subunit